MTRTQYRQARRLIRANGRYALRWLDVWPRHDMEHLLSIQSEIDWLDFRASWHAKPDTARANIVRLTTWIGA